MTMSRDAHRRHLIAGASTALFLSLAPIGVARAAADEVAPSSGVAGDQTAAGAGAPCTLPFPLHTMTFSAGPRIDNRFLPMPVGTVKVYRGTTLDDEGNRVPHEVVTVVTNLVKQVDGVPSRVILDVDRTAGVVAEAELAFFAQDDRGAVWNLGEYPEEYEDGSIAGAPSTWISGQQGASGGLHMLGYPAFPQNRHLEYLQGRAPRIDFLDCAEVERVGGVVQVPAGRFTDVLTTFERSPLESRTAIQTKEHAPGVGIVRIGAVNDPEGETLVLSRMARLTPAQLAEADEQVRTMDRRAYRTKDVYRSTGPLLVG
jgi:hypothetical protein